MAERKLVNLTNIDPNYNWNRDIDILMNRHLQKIILPIIRRVLPNLIADQLIGVQPMTGPVAQIMTLRYTYGEDTFGHFIRSCTLEKNGGIEIGRI